MPGSRVNVLVYAGPGTTLASVRHATWSLRRLLGSNYAVLTVTADQILKEPWPASCALLVMPGGADVGYCRTLDGAGNRRIQQYVQEGGAYLGLCAGGYYGCGKCEFEVGRKGMEVVGTRELGFFPGTCRGLAFSGFEYHSEAGARAARLEVNGEVLAGMVPDTFRAYYNGGGVFVDAKQFNDKGVEVLATYVDELAVDSGEDRAAVVYCRVGNGAAVLTGPHPEFSAINLNHSEPSGHSDYHAVVASLLADDQARVAFMKACLVKLQLNVSLEHDATPSLSRLHLSAAQPSEIGELLHALNEAGVVTKQEDGEQCIIGENDRFILEEKGRWGVEGLRDALPANINTTEGNSPAADKLIDYNTVTKHLLPHEHAIPDSKETPQFNHDALFANIRQYNTDHRQVTAHVFGSTLLYGEVVTSTSTLLFGNPTLLSHLPTGLTATATTQLAGRGRGSNVWVSPPGSLMFSTVLRHGLALSAQKAPVVFVQYLAALAIVEGVQKYGRGYAKIPVRLKWPNDIYALDPTAEGEEKYVKIGGILVNSSYAGGDYTIVCGVGVNVNNAEPTTSLSLLAKKLGLPPFQLERLLASILTQFEALYTRFCSTGFDKKFETMYYSSWLHNEQIVTLETEGGARARLKGITTDWGLLVAEELGWEDRPTGRTWQLQSDSNSFDFFRGLLKRKT